MSDPTHTPGPWGVEQTERHNWIGPLRNDGKIDTLVVSITREAVIPEVLATKDANARLIATAPELLEALRELLVVSEHADETGYVEDAGFVDLEAVQQKAHAAIAKAEGRAA